MVLKNLALELINFEFREITDEFNGKCNLKDFHKAKLVEWLYEEFKERASHSSFSNQFISLERLTNDVLNVLKTKYEFEFSDDESIYSGLSFNHWARKFLDSGFFKIPLFQKILGIEFFGSDYSLLPVENGKMREYIEQYIVLCVLENIYSRIPQHENTSENKQNRRVQDCSKMSFFYKTYKFNNYEGVFKYSLDDRYYGCFERLLLHSDVKKIALTEGYESFEMQVKKSKKIYRHILKAYEGCEDSLSFDYNLHLLSQETKCMAYKYLNDWLKDSKIQLYMDWILKRTNDDLVKELVELFVLLVNLPAPCSMDILKDFLSIDKTHIFSEDELSLDSDNIEILSEITTVLGTNLTQINKLLRSLIFDIFPCVERTVSSCINQVPSDKLAGILETLNDRIIQEKSDAESNEESDKEIYGITLGAYFKGVKDFFSASQKKQIVMAPNLEKLESRLGESLFSKIFDKRELRRIKGNVGIDAILSSLINEPSSLYRLSFEYTHTIIRFLYNNQRLHILQEDPRFTDERSIQTLNCIKGKKLKGFNELQKAKSTIDRLNILRIDKRAAEVQPIGTQSSEEKKNPEDVKLPEKAIKPIEWKCLKECIFEWLKAYPLSENGSAWSLSAVAEIAELLLYSEEGTGPLIGSLCKSGDAYIEQRTTLKSAVKDVRRTLKDFVKKNLDVLNNTSIGNDLLKQFTLFDVQLIFLKEKLRASYSEPEKDLSPLDVEKMKDAYSESEYVKYLSNLDTEKAGDTYSESEAWKYLPYLDIRNTDIFFECIVQSGGILLKSYFALYEAVERFIWLLGYYITYDKFDDIIEAEEYRKDWWYKEIIVPTLDSTKFNGSIYLPFDDGIVRPKKRKPTLGIH